MRPWSMIPTRSASTSASSRYCVVRNTVTPSSRARRPTSSQSAVRLCGSSPVVGSSRKRVRRRVDQREREVEPPLHAARVGPDLPVAGRGEPDAGEQCVDQRLPLRSADPVQRRLQAQVLATGQERVERRLLQRRADRRADLRPLPHDVEAGHRRPAGRGREERRQHVHRRRLPGPVRAQEAVDLAGRDRQVDPVDRPDRLEGPDQALDLDPVAFRPTYRRTYRETPRRPGPRYT